MKKICNLLFTFLLFYISFYYTNIVSEYVKNKDPIMIKLKTIENKYYKKPINAIINDNTIIPGISGSTIDINNSYLKMKKINVFEESLLIFKTIEPTISYKNNYDKLILSGNKTNKNISLLIKINNLESLEKLKQETYFDVINFIFEPSFFKTNEQYLNNLKNNKLIEEQKYLEDYKNIDYCYTTNINFQNNCSKYKKYTIYTNQITHDYFYNTYQKISNGSILSYNIIHENTDELSILINGIKNLGYEIVSLDVLLKE